MIEDGILARSNAPEPVFGGASHQAFMESKAVGLAFECTYDPAHGTMRARYHNARAPALQQSCLLFNDIPVGVPLVPIVRFNSRLAYVGASLTVMNP